MPLNVGELQATMNLDISKFSKNVNNVKNQLKSMGVSVGDNVTDAMEEAENSTEDFADSMQDAGKQAKNMAGQINTGTTAIQNQKKETEKATAKNETWKDSINNVKGAWSSLKGAIGALGIVAAMTTIINKVKEFQEECQKAEKAYSDFIQNSEMLTASSEISAQIQSMSISAAQGQTAGQEKFTINDYASAMAVLSAKYPDLLQNETEMKNMAETYLRFADVMGTDVAQAIRDADSVFKGLEVDVSDQADTLDYFYKAAAKVQLPLSEMINLLAEGDDYFKLMGMSAKESANYIAAVYQATGKTDDISTAISNVDKLTKSQYTTFGTDEEMKNFLRKVMTVTEGMTDQNEILNKINEIYNQLYPTLQLDAETGEMVQAEFTEMASTLQGFAKLSEVTTEDVSNMGASITELDLGLQDLKTTTEQLEEAQASLRDLAEKEYSVISASLQSTYESAKTEAMSWEGGYLDYWLNADTDTKKLYQIENALKYKNWDDYVMENSSDHFSRSIYDQLVANKDASASMKLEIVDSTQDGIAVRQETNKAQVSAANNPTMY